MSALLTSAQDIERKTYRISPSGYEIHWTILDEDLSINGLLKLAEKLSKNRSDDGALVNIG
ncbi:MAG: DUF2442 domain-containing protein [Planktothrix sp.]